MAVTISVSEFRFGKSAERAEFVVGVEAESDVRLSSKMGEVGPVSATFEVKMSPRRRRGRTRELKHPTEVGKLEDLAMEGVKNFCQDLLAKLAPRR
jgi:hypothetical protein